MIARTEGIEPPPTVLETAILPLNYVRMYSNEYIYRLLITNSHDVVCTVNLDGINFRPS